MLAKDWSIFQDPLALSIALTRDLAYLCRPSDHLGQCQVPTKTQEFFVAAKRSSRAQEVDRDFSDGKRGPTVHSRDCIKAAGQCLTERLDMGEGEIDFPMDLRLYRLERRAACQYHFHYDGLWQLNRFADLARDPDGHLAKSAKFLMDIFRQHLGQHIVDLADMCHGILAGCRFAAGRPTK